MPGEPEPDDLLGARRRNGLDIAGAMYYDPEWSQYLLGGNHGSKH